VQGGAIPSSYKVLYTTRNLTEIPGRVSDFMHSPHSKPFPPGTRHGVRLDQSRPRSNWLSQHRWRERTLRCILLKANETQSYANFERPAFKKVRVLRNPAVAFAITERSPSRRCGRRMNLSDIATRKLNDGGGPLLGCIRRDQYDHSGDGRFCKCFGKVATSYPVISRPYG
jgi:hypothetical protein